MSPTISKTKCFICDKEKITYQCKGCSQQFCLSHLTEHNQLLSQQFDQIEYHRDLFQQTIIEIKRNPHQHFLIQQINKWEFNSIEKIKQKAEEYRQIDISLNNTENKFNLLTKQLKEIRQFNEFDLNQFKIKLNKLLEELDRPKHIFIQQDSISIINEPDIIISSDKSYSYLNNKWNQDGITIDGGNGNGDKLNQLSQPSGIFIDNDQNIYIADSDNHRIIQWKYNTKDGRLVAGGNGKGNKLDQLNRPSHLILDKNKDLIICDRQNKRVVRWSCKDDTIGEIIIPNINCLTITMDQNGDIYVSDTEKHQVTRWKIGEKDGTIVAGGNGKGNNLNQLNFPSSIFIDKDYSLYISDSRNHRIVKWMKNAKEGIIIAQENNLTKLFFPLGLIVDHQGDILVVDGCNHQIMLWSKDKQEKIILGGNAVGDKSNQFNSPVGLALDQHGHLYVSDIWNHRIQKFEIDFN